MISYQLVRKPIVRKWLIVMVVLAGLAAFVYGCVAAKGPEPLAAAEGSSVKVWESQTVIPAYLAGDAEPNPLFFFGRTAPVYPYPMYDTLTGKKVPKTYTIIYLENEYVRIGVLPEIGGRVFEGLDKTNNYNFFYRQHVIKPALIGLIGAWISGGVEWNIPRVGHRETTFLPVQHAIEENADGSKTIWVGELELRQRMRLAVGYTLRPGKAYLEASVRILNRTPVENSMMCFANAAVPVDENYQVIFPPGTQYATGHGKRYFTPWPISEGVDFSWYKNHTDGSFEIFAWNYEDDFFAGYDHGKEAGTLSVTDHNVAPGKKFFTWGNSPAGKRWDRTLTDDDGPYVELQEGGYSDNQPDYSWLEPYEARIFSMNWYPFRDIGGVKKANLEAAVNLEVTQGTAKVGFYTTSAHPAARVTLKAGENVLLDEVIAINPAKPYVKQTPVPAGIDEHSLVAAISDGGKELVSYSPGGLRTEPAPAPLRSPGAPQDIKTSEELYVAGLRALEFREPNSDPMPYWDEALRRDPGDSRVNTVLGIVALTKARYAEAEKYFRIAVERVAAAHTNPRDGEALYYLGAALKAQGKMDEAHASFYKAAWNEAWKSASYYSLAEIAASRGDMPAALEFVGRASDSNAWNVRALNLKAAVLRHLGRPSEALEALAAAHRADPLDVRSMAERWLVSRTPESAEVLASTLNAYPATAQETAAEYMNAGLWQDGTDVLLQMTAAAPDKSRIHPMAYYYLGYFAGKLGQPQKAAEYDKLAMAMPPDYVFPFQNEEIEVLRAAAETNPRDGRALYYLGNVLYDWQPEEATKAWEASAAIEPSFAIVHRNLAVAYEHQKGGADVNKAMAELEKAVASDRRSALQFKELDDLYEQASVPLEKRLTLFEANAAVVAQRDDAENRAIALKVAGGKYDDAIQMMTGRLFAVAEGANINVADHWTEAHLFRAEKDVAAHRYAEALTDLQAAGAIPPNMPLRAAGGGGATTYRSAENAYWTGVTREAMGDHPSAVASWNLAAAAGRGAGGGGGRGAGGGGGFGGGFGGGRRGGFGGGQDMPYFQALALQKLGRNDQARTIFTSLVESGKNALQQQTAAPAARGGRGFGGGRVQSPRVRQANAHYLIGLGCLGLGDLAQARAELDQAVETCPDLIGPGNALASIQEAGDRPAK